MVVEVVRKRREDIINSNRRGCDLIWAPSLVRKGRGGGGGSKSIFWGY